MLGAPSDLTNPNSTTRGLIPQLLQAIFTRVNERKEVEKGVNIDVAVESLEIYNGQNAKNG